MVFPLFLIFSGALANDSVSRYVTYGRGNAPRAFSLDEIVNLGACEGSRGLCPQLASGA